VIPRLEFIECQLDGKFSELKACTYLYAASSVLFDSGFFSLANETDIQELVITKCTAEYDETSGIFPLLSRSLSSSSCLRKLTFSHSKYVDNTTIPPSSSSSLSTSLQHLSYINLSFCILLEDVSLFKNIPHLVLNSCSKVTDISCLTGVLNLSICQMSQLIIGLSIDPPHQVDKLTVSEDMIVSLSKHHSTNNQLLKFSEKGTFRVKQLHCHPVIEKKGPGVLVGTYLPYEKLLPPFLVQEVEHLSFVSCESLYTLAFQFSSLSSLPCCLTVLNMSSLKNLTKLDLFTFPPSLTVVRVIDCAVYQIELIDPVKEMTIKDCKNLRGLSIRNDMKKLAISGCIALQTIYLFHGKPPEQFEFNTEANPRTILCGFLPGAQNLMKR
jgi:hypothetical protein